MALAQQASASTAALVQLELLRQRLREALFAKKARLRELAELCTRQRAELRGWIQKRRTQALKDLNEELRRARSAAAATRRTRLQEARRSSGSAVELARAAVAIERAHAAEQLRITRAHETKRVSVDRAHARSLSDDQASASMLQRLGPLLGKARAIRPAPGESRTEALWRYARAHPEEMHALIEPKAERAIAQTRDQIAAVEDALRTGRPILIKPTPTPSSPEPKRSSQAKREAKSPARQQPTPAAPVAQRAQVPAPTPAPAAALPVPGRPRARPPAPQLGLDFTFSALPMASVGLTGPVVEPHTRSAPLDAQPSTPRPAAIRAERVATARPKRSTPPATAGHAAVSHAPPSSAAHDVSRSPPRIERQDKAETRSERRSEAAADVAQGDRETAVPLKASTPQAAMEHAPADDAAPSAASVPVQNVSADRAPEPAPVEDLEKVPPSSTRAGTVVAVAPLQPDIRESTGAKATKCEASYDPGDNKLRLRSVRRLDADTYARVKAAGFAWAPKQDLFVAPAWTPEREDLLLELCGDIEDEDTSLVDRAQLRAERFGDYAGKRAGEAEGARKAVSEIADNIPLGQPILVGHHSERHARRDAEKIESGMRKAVSLWKTSQYWQQRAKGALRHAKYKEQPGVRHRRIKGLEADRRKQVRDRERAEHFAKLWNDCTTTERAVAIANLDHLRTPDTLGPDGRVVTFGETYWSALKDGKLAVEQARERAMQLHALAIRRADRWIQHIDHRLTYERAMLDEGGGIPAAKFDLQIGGQVLDRFGWAVVLRLNRKGGVVTSVTTAGKFGRAVRSVEEIRDYRPPEAGDAEKVTKATKLPPLVNFPGEGFRHMTQAEWDKLSRISDFSRARRVEATEAHGAYRLRMAPKEGRPYYDLTGVYVTDARRVDPPPPSPRSELPARKVDVPAPSKPRPPAKEPTAFDAMAASLQAGVQVVSADQLFPTPPALAARMVALADLQPGQRVLEPSAGTGRLLRATLGTPGVEIVAVEIREDLARVLAPKAGESYSVRQGDFLALGANELGTFDRVIMNPPFASGADVKHILHARALLKPGGKLVAICANGPHQRKALHPLADTWEALPEGSFKASGTNVRTVLLTMKAPS